MTLEQGLNIRIGTWTCMFPYIDIYVSVTYIYKYITRDTQYIIFDLFIPNYSQKIAVES